MTTSDRCRAVDRRFCRTHGRKVTPGTADWLLSQPDQVRQPPAPILTDPEPLEKALTSTLAWDGTEPAGWSSYVDECQSHPERPGTPELLDVIPSPEGPLAVTWFHDSQDWNDITAPGEDGMRIHRVGLYSLTQKKDLGAVKVAYVDEEVTRQSFGDDELKLYRWAERYNSSFHEEVPTPAAWSQMTGEEQSEVRRKIWAEMMRARRVITVHEGKTISYQDITVEHAPATDREVVQAMKRMFLPTLKKEQKAQAASYAIPFIDRSSTEPELRGKGYGTAMYVYAARRLAQDGKVMKASGVQSPEAKRLWDRFQARFPNNVNPLTEKNQQGTKRLSLVMDFR